MKLYAKSGVVLALLVAVGFSRAEDKKVIEKKPEGEAKTEKEFVANAIACDTAEIKFAEKAVKQAKSEDVRKFAQKIIDNHTKNRESLLDAARDMKVGVVEGFDKEKKEKIDRILKLEGSDFDKEYIDCMVEAHEKALRQYEKWAKDSENEKLQGATRKAVPVLKEHLEEARRLQKTLKG